MFEETAKEMMQFDEDTGKIADGREWVAYQYIKFLTEKQGKYKEAINFIRTNLVAVRDSLDIMSKWYDIYRDTGKTRGIIEIAEAITSHTVSKDKDTNKYSVQKLNMELIKQDHILFIDNLLHDLREIINNLNREEPNSKIERVKALYDKVDALANIIKNSRGNTGPSYPDER